MCGSPISVTTYLEAAARILATEGEHSGSVRFACIEWNVVSLAVDTLMFLPPAPNPIALTIMPWPSPVLPRKC
jgi:hypothetical protein